MSIPQSLWASAPGRPRLHAEAYVAALSLWTLVSGHWSAWQAARVEVNQQQEAEQREQADVPGQIVERMV
jgi:hypothetical protein